jgi:hypothetical protein
VPRFLPRLGTVDPPEVAAGGCKTSPIELYNVGLSPAKVRAMTRFYEAPTETRLMIEAAVRKFLGTNQASPCNIFVVDEDGDEMLSVGICYESIRNPIDPRATVDMLASLRDQLVAIGEFRMPYVKHYFEEGQLIVGGEHACGPA